MGNLDQFHYGFSTVHFIQLQLLMSWTSCALLYVDVESLKDLQIIGTLESATSSTPADSRWCSSHFAVILVMNIASNRCVAVLVLIWGVGLKASLPFVKPAGKSKGHHSEVRNGTIRESIHDILFSKVECGHHLAPFYAVRRKKCDGQKLHLPMSQNDPSLVSGPQLVIW